MNLKQSSAHWLFIITMVAIASLAITLRIRAYGDPRLAVGTADTQSYVESSRPPLFSWASFTGRRLFTANLIYKMISSGSNCGQIVISYPAIGAENVRVIQPCYENLALLQTLLSIIGWFCLAWVMGRHLRTSLSKILAVLIIVLFAFTPQIAEWDSVLSSESLSFSLFALSLGLLIETVFSILNADEHADRYRNLIAAFWFIAFGLWVFVRDVHLYPVLITVLLMIPFSLLSRFRKTRFFAVSGALLAGLFIFGLISSKQSTRWQPSITHSLDTFIMPYPSRVDFMEKKLGMPNPNSAEYGLWFDKKAPTAFVEFLAVHPGLIGSTIQNNWIIFINGYTQPYYRVADNDVRIASISAGESLHPDSGVFYVIDLILLLAFWSAAVSGRKAGIVAWAWIFTWIYFTALITLGISFFGDTDGIMRHVLPSLETFRLFMWLALIVLIDILIQSFNTNASREIESAAGERSEA